MSLNNHSKNSRRCPKCGTDRICRDRRDGELDWMLSLINFYPYYCSQCPTMIRFYRAGRR